MGDIMELAVKSSQVRDKWSEFIDEVIHKIPKFVQRNERDVFMAINLEYVSSLLEHVRFSVEIEQDKETNEFVAIMDGFWFVESGDTEQEAINNLAKQLLDYAFDYFNEFQLHFNAPNLKPQFPQVVKALIINDVEGIKKFFDVKHKRS